MAQATVQVFWEDAGRFYLAGAASTDDSAVRDSTRCRRGERGCSAEAPGFARASTALVLSAEPRTVRLVLHPAEALDVTVRDEASAPIARATVLVDTADPLPFGALTDEHGVAHFSRLGAAPWSVKASAPGFESVSRTGVRGALTLTLRRLASLEVRRAGCRRQACARRHRDDRRCFPLAGAQRRGRLSGRRANRRAFGRKITICAPASRGFVSPTLLGFELGRGANEKLTFAPRAGAHGDRARDRRRRKNPIVVANADVVLAEAGLSSFPIRGRTGSGRHRRARSDRGRPGDWLGARAADFVGSALVAVPEVLDGPVRVPLTRGATIVGEVDDVRGYPIDGATIEVVVAPTRAVLPIAETPALVGFRQNHFAWSLPGPVPLIPAGELGVMPGPVPPIPRPGAEVEVASNAADFSEPLSDLAPWVTNRGGEFTARPVTPGRVRVIVRHPDYVEGTSEARDGWPPAGKRRSRSSCCTAARSKSHVVDERGQPVSRRRGRAQLTPRGYAPELATTASDGTFAFAAVPAGDHALARATWKTSRGRRFA